MSSSLAPSTRHGLRKARLLALIAAMVTFGDSQNATVAIFMDSRNTTAFASQHTVVYGHNIKNGTMFGRLHHYLDDDYLARHSVVTATPPEEIISTCTTRTDNNECAGSRAQGRPIVV